MRLQVQKITKYFKCKFIKNKPWIGSELLRKSKSSPSWIFKALVPVPEVVADVLVFVQGIRGGWANFSAPKQEFKDGNKEFENSERRRPAEAWVWYRSVNHIQFLGI